MWFPTSFFAANRNKSAAVLVHKMFSEPPIKRFAQPVIAAVEVEEGFLPRIRYNGTTWKFRCPKSGAVALTHGQEVKVVGRQGICLLVELEAIDVW